MPGCGRPSFLAFKDGHNAVQTLGIFRTNKSPNPAHYKPGTWLFNPWWRFKVNSGSR